MTTSTAAFWFPVLYLGGIGFLFAAYIRWNRASQRVAVARTLYVCFYNTHPRPLSLSDSCLTSTDADAHQDGYFAPHVARTQYNELSEMFSPDDPNGQMLLMTALMKRAVADVQRVFHIKEEKPPLQQLVSKGTVGEDLLEKLNTAEGEMDGEINEVVEEAEMYKAGWGKTIFQEASQLVQMQAQREAQLTAQRAQTLQQQQQQAAAAVPDDHESNATSPTSTDASSPAASSPTNETDAERSQRIANELMLEEENEKKRAAGKGGKGGKGKPTKKKSVSLKK
ncbi:translocation protein S66 [Thoreauomyces humboldtii]|nr:translocation protein S66 [Thoreauomyces humboldtii]